MYGICPQGGAYFFGLIYNLLVGLESMRPLGKLQRTGYYTLEVGHVLLGGILGRVSLTLGFI